MRLRLTLPGSHSILTPIEIRRGCHVRLLPNIRFGTERYPEKVARRLRALNIATRIASVVAGGYVIVPIPLYDVGLEVGDHQPWSPG